MTRVPDGVRAVFFDAVGTLIHPEPSAADAYLHFGRQFGCKLPADEIRRRFGAAFSAQERLDSTRGHRTDEARELARWRRIVAEVLDDVADADGCFRALHDWFARPAAWRAEPGAGEALRRLDALGYAVGIASNFDYRLRGVVAGIDELRWVRRLLISSEAGWKKPSGGFFTRLCELAGSPPSLVLYIGDDLDNDLAGARAAGLRAMLLAPGGRGAPLPPEDRLDGLADLFSGG
ncbi:MAG: HAD-IA family hydrolase [Gemmataceae bacterium]